MAISVKKVVLSCQSAGSSTSIFSTDILFLTKMQKKPFLTLSQFLVRSK